MRRGLRVCARRCHAVMRSMLREVQEGQRNGQCIHPGGWIGESGRDEMTVNGTPASHTDLTPASRFRALLLSPRFARCSAVGERAAAQTGCGITGITGWRGWRLCVQSPWDGGNKLAINRPQYLIYTCVHGQPSGEPARLHAII